MSKFILFSKLNRKKEKTVLKVKGSRWYSFVQNQHKFLNILMVALIISLGVSYLFSVNQTASRGFEVSSLEEEVETLAQQNKKLELEASELLSMSNVQEVSQDMNLVPVERVEYLRDSMVALSD